MDDSTPLVMYGVGGMGRDALEMVKDIGLDTWNVIGWLDDNLGYAGTEVQGLPVLGTAAWLRDNPEVSVSVTIGYSAPRWRAVQRLKALGHTRFATLLHPLAYIAERAEVGEGSIVAPYAVLSTETIVGKHSLLNFGCVVGHDCKLSSFVSIAPNTVIGGGSRLHEGANFGMSAGTMPNTVVGEWADIGGGAFVTRDVPANSVTVGVPAKAIRERPLGWHAGQV